jgi:hypothetical protein
LISKVRFYQTLNSKVTLEINRVKEEMAEMEQASQPTTVNHPIDDNLQTGDSRLLGGGMSIHAPWSKESEE